VLNILLEIIIALEITLAPIVTAQISKSVNQIAIAISDITDEPIDQALFMLFQS
jgi:hypothetical protein